MFHLLPNSLIALAKNMPKPLFIVGGAVRDFLIGFENQHADWDICSPMLAEDFAKIAKPGRPVTREIFYETILVNSR